MFVYKLFLIQLILQMVHISILKSILKSCHFNAENSACLCFITVSKNWEMWWNRSDRVRNINVTSFKPSIMPKMNEREIHSLQPCDHFDTGWKNKQFIEVHRGNKTWAYLGGRTAGSLIQTWSRLLLHWLRKQDPDLQQSGRGAWGWGRSGCGRMG